MFNFEAITDISDYPLCLKDGLSSGVYENKDYYFVVGDSQVDGVKLCALCLSKAMGQAYIVCFDDKDRDDWLYVRPFIGVLKLSKC